jgi:hypothetical protein
LLLFYFGFRGKTHWAGTFVHAMNFLCTNEPSFLKLLFGNPHPTELFTMWPDSTVT